MICANDRATRSDDASQPSRSNVSWIARAYAPANGPAPGGAETNGTGEGEPLRAQYSSTG